MISRLIFKTSFIILIAFLVRLLIMPLLFVASLIPGLTLDPIEWLTLEPKVITQRLDRPAGFLNFDRYEPRESPTSLLVFFHGANDRGKDDPRIQNLASLFARSNTIVYVPTLPSLNREKFHPRVIEEMKAVINQAKNDYPHLPAAVFGVSVAVGPQLLALSDQTIGPKVDLAMGLGSYYRLEDVVAYHTFGEANDPFGLWLLARYYAQFLPEADSRIFHAIADRKRSDPESDISDLAANLSSKGGAALALLVNKDPEQFEQLLNNLPAELKNFFASLNPAHKLSELKPDIFLLHSIHDPVIPYEQSVTLHAELRRLGKDAEFMTLKIFDHVNPQLPSLTFRTILDFYLPELAKLYYSVAKIIY